MVELHDQILCAVRPAELYLIHISRYLGTSKQIYVYWALIRARDNYT